MKWLEDNPVGIGLSALCGFFLLVLLVLTVLSSLPVSTASDDAEEGVDNSALELPVLADNQPLDTYSVITERPLFNENRQPIIEVDGLGEEIPLELDENAGKPEVELSGVVITPTLRIAMLKRKDDDTSLVAFEGMPIEADFGNWEVSKVQPRTATLTSLSGEELHLEMKVHDAKIEEPETPPERQPAQDASNATAAAAHADASGEDAPLSRAEEIRRRIAERREELRREAEEAGMNGDQEDARSYQDAIQSMMGRGRREDSNNDNEQ